MVCTEPAHISSAAGTAKLHVPDLIEVLGTKRHSQPKHSRPTAAPATCMAAG